MGILRQNVCMVVNPTIWLIALLPSLNARLILNDGSLLNLRWSVLDCGAHRGPVCVVLVFWLQIATEAFCFASSVV